MQFILSIFPCLQELLICPENSQWDQCDSWLTQVQSHRRTFGPWWGIPLLWMPSILAVAMIMLMYKESYYIRKLEGKFPYLIPFIPPNILHFWKCLGAFHHKVNEVATPTQAAYDEDVGQDPQEPPQVDVLIFVAFLLIHDRFLKKKKNKQQRYSQNWSK